MRLMRLDGIEALLQFLSWIPMNDVLSPQFMDVLFKFIHLPNDSTSLAAFACINEILAQNFVPKEFSEFMVTIFKELFLLLQALTQSRDGLSQIEEEFVLTCHQYSGQASYKVVVMWINLLDSHRSLYRNTYGALRRTNHSR